MSCTRPRPSLDIINRFIATFCALSTTDTINSNYGSTGKIADYMHCTLYYSGSSSLIRQVQCARRLSNHFLFSRERFQVHSRRIRFRVLCKRSYRRPSEQYWEWLVIVSIGRRWWRIYHERAEWWNALHELLTTSLLSCNCTIFGRRSRVADISDGNIYRRTDRTWKTVAILLSCKVPQLQVMWIDGTLA